MTTAYIVKAYRTAVGKAPKGLFRFKRPDELAAETIEYMMTQLPELDKNRIDDVMVGNAMPEAEQGLNMARLISLMGLKTDSVPGVTVNRYCASGLETIAMATAKIQSGMADCIIAGGAESMSFIPMGSTKAMKIIIGAWVSLRRQSPRIITSIVKIKMPLHLPHTKRP
jgi:acetyl-CoA acyltransferase